MVKEVVVLGGGYAGTRVAVDLDSSPLVNVTMVDQREAMIHKIGGLRAAVDPKFSEKVVVPRTKTLKNGKVIQGEVTSINDDRGVVTLADGTSLPYDYLVCATGAVNSSPGEPPASLRSIAEIKKFYKDTTSSIAQADSYVIIGGGVVGVELAGELRTKYPKKPITLVHSQSKLISSSIPPLFDSSTKRLLKQMKNLKIDVILQDRLPDLSVFEGKPFVPNPTVTLSSGKSLSGGLLFNCVGYKLSTSFYPAKWKDSKGALKVDNTFVVEGTNNVFACGDLTNLVENKQAYFANSMHGPTVAKNILALVENKKAIKTHTPSDKPFMVVPLGKKHGVMVAQYFTLGPFMTSMAKGKTLFLPMGWVMNNQKTPSAN